MPVTREGGDTFEFYGGRAILKKRMYGTKPSFKRVDGDATILSVTGVTGKLDKSKALIPWACGLVGTHITAHVEGAKSEHFSREEILILVGEAVLAPDRAKVSGADTGTMIHDFAHDFAKAKLGEGEMPSLDKFDESIEEQAKALNGINAFLDWYNENEVEFLEMEKLVYYNSLLAGDSKEGEPITEFYGYLDLFARVNGKLAIIDYKSSKGIYNEQRYQVAGLRRAYDKERLALVGFGELKPKGAMVSDCGMIVNFNKITGELIPPASYNDEETDKDFAAFLGLHSLALRERELEKEYRNGKK